MKKLERKQVAELRKTIPSLDNNELLSIVGGTNYTYYFDKNGHFLSSGVSIENAVVVGNNKIVLSGELEGFNSEENFVSFSGVGATKELFVF